MRLLDTHTLELITFANDDIPLYAILSHRWGAEEVSLQDIIGDNADGKAGYTKVRKVCSVAASHGLGYVWVDTCCIDQTSSAELSEAINSMYRWYQDSAVCYAFLGDVELDQSAREDAPFSKRYPGFSKTCWLTRGWTLQELIAPSLVIFLDSAWKEIGTKSNLRPILSRITGIPESILAGEPPQTASIAQRFSWASSRKTTRPEDIAYCLMGLFNVNMPMLYGEGEKAFIRLQEQIIKVSDDHTIFAWTWPAWHSWAGNGGLLATSPAAFSSCSDMVPWDSSNARNTLSHVISTNNKGIHLKLNFIPGKNWDEVHTAVLPCRRADNWGTWIGVPLKAMSPSLQSFTRVASLPLRELSLDNFPEFAYPRKDICVQHGRQRHREQPAIVKAAECGNVKLVQLLLEKGADTESRDESNHRTALLAAARAGHSSVTELLVTYGAHIEAVDADGYTPLLQAAMSGHASVVQLLINQGAKVDATAGDGQTPLMWAAQEGHDSVIRILISMGAKLEAVDHAGSTPLLWAVAREHLAAARVLVLEGANFDVRDGGGSTPLMCAAESGQAEMSQLLIDYGANIEARDGNGQKALQIAVERGHENVAKIIRAGSSKGSGWRAPGPEI